MWKRGNSPTLLNVYHVPSTPPTGAASPLIASPNDVQILDEWYQRRCDGFWEHRCGVTIETCDNPGWLMTFHDLPLSNHHLGDLLDKLRQEQGAEVRWEGTSVRIFARSLERCLAAARQVVELSRSGE